jgi:hypothetical protein
MSDIEARLRRDAAAFQAEIEAAQFDYDGILARLLALVGELPSRDASTMSAGTTNRHTAPPNPHHHA